MKYIFIFGIFWWYLENMNDISNILEDTLGHDLRNHILSGDHQLWIIIIIVIAELIEVITDSLNIFVDIRHRGVINKFKIENI